MLRKSTIILIINYVLQTIKTIIIYTKPLIIVTTINNKNLNKI